MTRQPYIAVFALLAFIASTAAGHAATITDEFVVSGSDFFNGSGTGAPVPFPTFNATFDVTFDPAITTNTPNGATQSGFTLKSASFGYDPSYYGFRYLSPVDGGPSMFVGGVDPALGIIGSTGHFDFDFNLDGTGDVGYLRYITADGQFFASTASVSESEVSATPLPPAFSMFAAALIGLAGLSWARKRDQVRAIFKS